MRTPGATIPRHPREDICTEPRCTEGGGEALQQFIVEVVLPQLHQVNRDTTTQCYETVRVKLQQTDWGVPLRTHPTWPEVQTLSRKRKTTKSNRSEDLPTRGAQAARREMRQMQLWETRPQDHRAADSSPAGGGAQHREFGTHTNLRKSASTSTSLVGREHTGRD